MAKTKTTKIVGLAHRKVEKLRRPRSGGKQLRPQTEIQQAETLETAVTLEFKFRVLFAPSQFKYPASHSAS